MSNHPPVMEGARQKTSVNVEDETVRPSPFSTLSDRPRSFDPRTFLTELTRADGLRECRPGEVVFSQGAEADAVFWIESGEVKLTVVSHQGKEAVIAILPEGSFFGEECLAGQRLRMATATAMQTAKIIRVPKATMMRLLRREPQFAEGFIGHLLSRHVRMEEDLLDQLFNSSEKRLARLLLLMAHFGEDADPLPVIGKISHETLAEMIGTTRSRVTFFMNRFRRQGFIKYHNGLRVHSSLLSVVLRD